MADDSAPCPACEQPVAATDEACPHCGERLASESQRAPAPKFARTMFGIPGQGHATPVPPSDAPMPADAEQGASGPDASVASDEGEGGSGVDAVAEDGPSTGPVGAPGAPEIAPPAPQASEQAADAKLSAKGRTMLGLAPGLSEEVKAAVEQARKPKAPQEPTLNPKRTQFEPLADEAPGEPAHKAKAAAAQALGGRTMLGVPNPGAAAAGSGTDAGGDPVPASTPSMSYPSSPEVPVQNKSLWILAGVAIALVFAGAAALLLPDDKPPAPASVQVSIVEVDGGDAMRFAAPDAPPGAKIVFGEQTQVLSGGEARFPLAVDSLVVGENLVVAQLVPPDGEPEEVRIPLKLDFRVRFDTAPLFAGKPELKLVVAAVPGSEVQVDAEPLPLSDGGKAVKRYPIDVAEAGRSGVLEHRASYRIEPPEGEVVSDTLTARVPVTMMQIDSPGFEVVTDQKALPVTGVVSKGTKVTLAGHPLPVDDKGHFAERLLLDQPGVYTPSLVATAPDKVPMRVPLKVTRVDDLAAAANAHAAGAALSFAKMAEQPDAQKGERVSFEGRVFRAKSEGGRSVLQMLVRDCPKGMQCSLWVTYPAAIDVAVDSWVRVVGDADGVQRFRAKNNEVVSVPRVAAAFVLPLKR